MNNLTFWNSLKTNWSTLQTQAHNTMFNTELLTIKIGKQITNAKKIRQNHFQSNDFLTYSDEDCDEY